MTDNAVTNVLIIAGNDPTGGAGLSADIETITSLGAHACPVVSCLTVQDLEGVYRVDPVAADLIDQQARTILAAIDIHAIKIGLLGGIEAIQTVAALLSELVLEQPDLPVILDPVLIVGATGASLIGSQHTAYIQAMHDLLPLVTLVTPNVNELRQLTDKHDVSQAADQLLAMGCDAVLVTGTDTDLADEFCHDEVDEPAPVVHRLFQQPDSRWTIAVDTDLIPRSSLIDADPDHTLNLKLVTQRLPNQYHGSGCTLASGIASLMAQQSPLVYAVCEAQQFTWLSLASGWLPEVNGVSASQYLPYRLFWTHAADSAMTDLDEDIQPVEDNPSMIMTSTGKKWLC